MSKIKLSKELWELYSALLDVGFTKENAFALTFQALNTRKDLFLNTNNKKGELNNGEN